MKRVLGGVVLDSSSFPHLSMLSIYTDMILLLAFSVTIRAAAVEAGLEPDM